VENSAKKESLDQKVERLAHELAVMRNRFDDLKSAVISESKDTTKHVTALYYRIRDLSEYVMPIVDKTFPRLRGSQRKITDFLERARREAGDRNGEPSA
jgi:hypothetical protein